MRDWDKWLVHCEFAYNNAQHKSTGYSPFQLAYGRHPTTPASLATHGCGADHFAERFLEEREAFRKRGAEALEVAWSTDAQQVLHNSRQYSVGEKIWLSKASIGHSPTRQPHGVPSATSDSTQQWHRRLGCLGHQARGRASLRGGGVAGDQKTALGLGTRRKCCRLVVLSGSYAQWLSDVCNNSFSLRGL